MAILWPSLRSQAFNDVSLFLRNILSFLISLSSWIGHAYCCTFPQLCCVLTSISDDIVGSRKHYCCQHHSFLLTVCKLCMEDPHTHPHHVHNFSSDHHHQHRLVIMIIFTKTIARPNKPDRWTLEHKSIFLFAVSPVCICIGRLEERSPTNRFSHSTHSIASFYTLARALSLGVGGMVDEEWGLRSRARSTLFRCCVWVYLWNEFLFFEKFY